MLALHRTLVLAVVVFGCGLNDPEVVVDPFFQVNVVVEVTPAAGTSAAGGIVIGEAQGRGVFDADTLTDSVVGPATARLFWTGFGTAPPVNEFLVIGTPPPGSASAPDTVVVRGATGDPGETIDVQIVW